MNDVGSHRFLIAVISGGACAILAIACGLLTGVGDLVVGDVGAGDGAATLDAVQVDGDLDAATAADAPPSPTCVCVPVAPDGWTGPVALLRGAGPPPSCPPGLAATLEAGAGLAAAPACSPCVCGSPTGACSGVDVQGFENICGNVPCGPAHLVGPGCTNLAGAGCGGSGGSAAQATVDPGAAAATCAAEGGVASTSWASTATGCVFATSPDAGCPTGTACAPESPAAPSAPKCVFRAGKTSCPAGPYSARSDYATGVTDTRQCGACTCGAAANVSCDGGAITVYAQAGCVGALGTATVNGACKDVVGAILSAKMTAPPTMIGGSCVAGGGGFLGGSATEANPTTVCCLP